MPNVYFELTREFNRDATVAVLSSGQAVVWYRLSLMSKDGDWIVREDEPACARVLEVLGAHGARYRPSAPLDPRWLCGGWSSHFEFSDERQRRVRCDFVSRPPRVRSDAIRTMFGGQRAAGDIAVIDLESLVVTKQTQRAKDYPIIGALARLLPAAREILYTTDPDRVIDLAATTGTEVGREAVAAARRGAPRSDVVVALARETDEMQQRDRARIERYLAACAEYLREFQRLDLGAPPLGEAHPRVCELAERLLPAFVTPPQGG